MRAAPRHAAGIASLIVGGADVKFLQDFLADRFSLTRRGAKAVIDGRNVWVNRKCIWIARYSLKAGDTVEVPSSVIKAAQAQAKGKREEVKGKREEMFDEPSNHQTIKPSNHQTLEPSNHQTIQPSNHPTLEPSNRQTVKPSNRQTVKHIRILWQDDDYLICDKPSGMLSCESERSVEAALREQENLPGLEAVHRLDRDTTGCLMFAKRHTAKEAAVEVFRSHKVVKTYHAIVAGKFKYAKTRIDAPLDGDNAVTNVSREMTGDEASFLRVKIETGRTNQIRRHLSSIRAPIVGDRVFGLKAVRDRRLMQVPRQMLHASTLELPNPLKKGERIKAHSPLPADFRAALRLFGMGR